MNRPSFVYMLRCADGSFYSGWTNDLPKRFVAHSTGRGAKYTRSRRPVEIVYCEMLASKSLALVREIALKKLNHRQKALLCASAMAKTAQLLAQWFPKSTADRPKQ